MEAHVLSPELARNTDAVIGLAGITFIVFDSFSKRADVTSLKKELDLRRSQLLASIVGAIEKVITPLLEERASQNFDDGLISRPAAIVDETVRNALTEVIRDNEPLLMELRIAKALPNEIHQFNAYVFRLIVATSLTSFFSAGLLTIFATGPELTWWLLGAPSFTVLATAAVAVKRHTKVQNAERQILDNDPQT